MNFTKAALAIAVGFASLASPLAAQDAPYLKKGNIEGNIFLGGSKGLDSWRWSSGLNVAYAVSRTLMPYAEYSYFPGIARQVNSNGAVSDSTVPASDIHAGVHYRIPLGQKGFVPYLVGAAGLIHWNAAPETVAHLPLEPGLPTTYTFRQIAPSNVFAVNFGAGVRYYVFGESSGFRTEFKVYKPLQAGNDNSTAPFYKATIGFFYQFK